MSVTAVRTPQDAGQHELIITRTLDAPRALVFQAWTQPEHLVRWLGPHDFTCISAKMDARPGGSYRAGIRGPEGKVSWMRGIYREIVEPERLVLTFAWEKEGSSEQEGDRGHETEISIALSELNGKTRMTFRQAYFETTENRDSHNKGWTESFERLAQHLAGER